MYWINLFPIWIIKLLGPFSIIIAGILIERHFVGRMTIFANTLAINIFFFGTEISNTIFAWYLNIGLVVGFIGLICYIFREKLPEIYYIVGLLYHSFVVGIIMIISLLII